jgi:hypothetical protein
MNDSPSCRARVADAISAAITEVTDRRIAPPVAVSRAVERILAILDEIPTEQARLDAAYVLAELDRLGNRSAASSLARRLAPGDPHRQEILAQRFRRLRRKKANRARLPSERKATLES